MQLDDVQFDPNCVRVYELDLQFYVYDAEEQKQHAMQMQC